MKIERRYTTANVQQLFFPVNEEPVSYHETTTGKHIKAPKHKALVDAERGTVLSVVSKRYKVVTNETAYGIVRPVADAFFGGGGLRDFECFNILVPKSRASCRIDLTRRDVCDFEIDGDKYMAFIRMANSYNRTSRLTVIIGFCRWICLNGCIFGEKSFTFSVDHSDSRLKDPEFIKETVDKAVEKIGDVAIAQKSFIEAVSCLKTVPLSQDQIKQLFCKVFGISLNDRIIKDLSDEKRERLRKIRGRLNCLTNSYVEEFGASAYAAYNVLTDFASYSVGNKAHSVKTPAMQENVGTWLRTFSSLIRDAKLDIGSYLADYKESQECLLKA